MEAMRVILLILSVFAVLIALLNFVRLPDTTLWWKVTLGVNEYGHWMVLLLLIQAGLAVWATEGPWRWAILGLCSVAGAGFLRPAMGAARLSDDFSWVRLFWSPATGVGTVRTEVYARPGGRELKLDLYLPPLGKDSNRGRPCLIVIHGGGWDSGDNTQLTDWNHRWAARGWAVAAINYRLAPAHPWPAQRDDVLAAIAWVKANADRLGLDAGRLVVLGRSAGGQIATAAAYGARDPAIRGVIALYAPHDMQFAWGVSREDDALNSVRLMRQYFGGPPDAPARVALYDSASGQLLARGDSPPTLLVHGHPDRLVWYRHSRRLAARLAELGVDCTHVELPWATHAFDYNPDGPGGQVTDAAISKFLERVTQ
jgi:acetyl esterase/lipase